MKKTFYSSILTFAAVFLVLAVVVFVTPITAGDNTGQQKAAAAISGTTDSAPSTMIATVANEMKKMNTAQVQAKSDQQPADDKKMGIAKYEAVTGESISGVTIMKAIWTTPTINRHYPAVYVLNGAYLPTRPSSSV